MKIKTYVDVPAMPVQGFCADASGALTGQFIVHTGLTKREQFAAMAMQGLAAVECPGGLKPETIAIDVKNAVLYADLLLGELDRSKA